MRAVEREPQNILEGLGNGLARVRNPSSGSAWWRCLALPLRVTHPNSASFLLYLGDYFHCTVKATPKASCFWPLRSTEGYLIIAAVWVAR